MKIVQVIGSLRGGGAERVCLELHQKFLDLGHNAFVYFFRKDIDYKVEDSNIIFYSNKEILEKIKKDNYDLVIAHMDNSAILLEELKEQNNIFFVIHNTISKKIDRKNFFTRIKDRYKIKQLYKDSNVVAVSKGVEADFINNLDIKIKSITTIYNPFNFERIEKNAEEVCSLNFDYIINIGALNRVKRQDLLIQAFAKLNTKLHLVILGKGGQLNNLKKLTKILNIEDRVHFLGWVENPYKYIKNAKLFVLSSDVEGLPTVLIESLILKTPVVSTNCPSGPSEILIDDLSNYLVEVNNSNALAKKIEEALTSYPKIENKHIERFEDKKIANEYISLIEKEK